MRVLLGHHGLRGDLALNLPAITYLHDAFGWQIDMPIHRRFADMAPLFLNHPALAGVVVTDGYDDFPSARDREALRSRGYDRVYSPMQGHFTDRWFETCHQTDAVLMDYLGMRLPPEYRQIKLTRWWDHAPLTVPVVAISPFAGFESNPLNDKRLSTERAQEVVDYLVAKGYGVMQLGGPGEPRLRGGIMETGDYFSSIRAMLTTKALITTDSGSAWYASAYQHPTLGLYGHRYYGAAHVSSIQPVNPRARYLDAATVADISLDLIKAEIDILLSS